jgi:hypothetical protein
LENRQYQELEAKKQHFLNIYSKKSAPRSVCCYNG